MGQHCHVSKWVGVYVGKVVPYGSGTCGNWILTSFHKFSTAKTALTCTLHLRNIRPHSFLACCLNCVSPACAPTVSASNLQRYVLTVLLDMLVRSQHGAGGSR